MFNFGLIIFHTVNKKITLNTTLRFLNFDECIYIVGKEGRWTLTEIDFFNLEQ